MGKETNGNGTPETRDYVKYLVNFGDIIQAVQDFPSLTTEQKNALTVCLLTVQKSEADLLIGKLGIAEKKLDAYSAFENSVDEAVGNLVCVYDQTGLTDTTIGIVDEIFRSLLNKDLDSLDPLQYREVNDIIGDNLPDARHDINTDGLESAIKTLDDELAKLGETDVIRPSN